MELDAELIKKVLEEQKGDISKAVLEQVQKNITDNLVWHLRDQVAPIVKEFFEQELKGEVKEHLLNHKDIILEAMNKATVDIAVEIAGALRAKAVENLTRSWNVDKILDGLFKG